MIQYILVDDDYLNKNYNESSKLLRLEINSFKINAFLSLDKAIQAYKEYRLGSTFSIIEINLINNYICKVVKIYESKNFEKYLTMI